MLIYLPPWIKTHRYIIVLTLLIGLISSLPQYIEKSTRENFAGIHMGVIKDTGFYMTRTQEVIDGHPRLGNPYLYEHKDGVPAEFWIPDVIIAKPIQWLGMTIAHGYMLWTFLLTTILAFLSYVVLLLLTRSRLWSIYGVIFIHLGMFGLKFMRLPSPGLNFIFYLLTLLFLILFIQKGTKRYAVLSAIAFGSLFHVYTYYWTFFVVVFVTYVVLAFILKVKDFPYKRYLLIFVGGLIIGIPYFLSMFRSSGLPGHSETLARIGLIHTHFPSGIFPVAVAGLVTLVFLFFYYRKIISATPINTFLFAGVVSTAIVMNQHLITGMNLEFSSHYLLGNMYWCIAAFIYLFVIGIHKISKVAHNKILFVLTILIPVYGLAGAAKMIDQQITFREAEVYAQNYAPIFDWFNKNALPEEVVFTSDEIGDYVPMFTSQNVFFVPGITLYYMTNEEVTHRFLIGHYFDTFTEEFIREKQRNIFGGVYLNEYGHNQSKNKLRKLVGMQPVVYELLPAAEVVKIKALASTTQSQKFENLLKTYRTDYIVWDSNKYPQWKIKDISSFKEVFSSNGIIIYEIL